ncbi:Alpha/Beta hydrolase protein [Obelidium mucronatum]|nr:Alpha/Beta hydrolase protein [Obelidium mucronatum]
MDSLFTLHCDSPNINSNEPDSMRLSNSSLEKLAHIEGILLKRHVSTPFRRHLVQPQGRDWAINTLVLNGPADGAAVLDPGRPTLVLTHGYGSGLGFFYANYDQLARLTDAATGQAVQIVAVDWLGCGGSSRARFAKRRCSDADAGADADAALVGDAERYFVDAFEEWRAAVGLPRFALAGHSLGGYLSAVYAVRHPHRVASLTLLSPFGLPCHPQDSVAVTKDVARQLPLAQRLFLSAWTNNVTPQWILRGLGPYGPRMASRIVSRRFPAMDEHDQRLISDYVYNLSTVRPAAGEYALNALMEVRMVPSSSSSGSSLRDQESSKKGNFNWSLYARHPVGLRLMQLPAHMPVSIVFGDNDWMFANRRDILKLDVVSSRAQSKLHVLSNAGHHLYLDNPDEMFQVFQKSRLWG